MKFGRNILTSVSQKWITSVCRGDHKFFVSCDLAKMIIVNIISRGRILQQYLDNVTLDLSEG